MQIFLFFALFIAILAIIFAIQNNDSATVSFLLWESEGSLALVLLLSMAAGALISYLVSLPSSIKNRLEVRNLRKKIQDLEKYITEYEGQIEELNKGEAETDKELPIQDDTTNVETQSSAPLEE
jgi:uncharacterized integral membrane protein